MIYHIITALIILVSFDAKTAVIFAGGVVLSKTIEWVVDNATKTDVNRG